MMANMPDVQTLRIAAEWWMRLRDPAASEQTTEQWLAWTDQDASHLVAFEQIVELATRLGAMGEVTRARLVAEFAPVRPVSRRWLPLGAAAAAAAVLALAVGYLAWTRDGVTGQSYASVVAGHRDLVLADGSHVAMGAATRLTTRFGGGRRQVDLAEGEAYFEVVHDASHPFVVHAGKVAIEDIGTAFDVRRTGDRVTIAMARGKVRIVDDRGRSLEAVAGQSATYDPAHPAMRVEAIDPAQVAAWRDARLEFDNAPLPVVVANINRYRVRPLRIADADLDALTFTGTVRTDAIDDWLRALPRVLPVRVSQSAGQTELSRAPRAPEPR